jgi:hypothetical protein
MKQITLVFKAVLLVAVFVSLAACSGGTFIDPGHGGGGTDGGNYSNGNGDGGSGGGSSGGGSGSVSKPSRLSNNATYAQSVAKVDEIIDYCEARPGATNDAMNMGAQSLKSGLSYPGVQSSWSSMADRQISAINAFIGQLQ